MHDERQLAGRKQLLNGMIDQLLLSEVLHRTVNLFDTKLFLKEFPSCVASAPFALPGSIRVTVG
jgi:hypothetical protein